MAQRKLKNVLFYNEDLLLSKIPIADTYFFYFPTGKVLDRILFELKSLKHDFKVVVIESHGEFISRLKFESWLEVLKEIPLSSPRHYPNAVIYRKNSFISSSIFDHSFLRDIVFIKQNGTIWLGESFDLEYLSDKEVTLRIPPRSIAITSIEKVARRDGISQEFWPALKLRMLGELEFETLEGKCYGHIRKIFVSPSFELELSSGKKVKWSDIKTIKWENQLCYDCYLQYFYCPDAP